MNLKRSISVVAAILTVAATATAAASAASGTPTVPPTAISDSDQDPFPANTMYGHAPPPESGAVYGSAPFAKTGTAICTTQTSYAANVNTDCGPVAPHQETSIAVDPRDPNHLIGAAYDTQVAVNPALQVSYTHLSRAHVSVDGGRRQTTPVWFESGLTCTWMKVEPPSVELAM